MITELGRVKLREREEMVVKCVEPPEEEYREKLMRFLEHKDDLWMRDINQRLNGNYVKFCIDRYFVGEMRGKVVSQMWYGLSKDGTGMGNFGHVYTEPEYRKRGIANELMKFLVEDFQKSKGKALFCGTDSSWVANIYIKYSFQLIKKKTSYGPMVLIKSDYAKDFQELEKKYFKPGSEINVRLGSIKDQFDCDKVLVYSSGFAKLSSKWHRVFLASKVSTFREALFRVEDGRGIVTVAETSKGNIVGYAFILALGSSIEERSKILDFVIHPNYMKKLDQFLKETINIARKKGINTIWSYVIAPDEEKLFSLLKVGFKEVDSLPSYCFLNNRYFDLKMMCYKFKLSSRS